ASRAGGRAGSLALAPRHGHHGDGTGRRFGGPSAATRRGRFRRMPRRRRALPDPLAGAGHAARAGPPPGTAPPPAEGGTPPSGTGAPPDAGPWAPPSTDAAAGAE